MSSRVLVSPPLVGGPLLTVVGADSTDANSTGDTERVVADGGRPIDDDRTKPSSTDAESLFEAHEDPSVFYAIREDGPVALAVNGAFRDRFGVEGDVTNRPLPDVLPETGDDVQPAVASEDDLDRPCDVGDETYRLRSLSAGRADGQERGYLVYTELVGPRDTHAALARENERLEEFASIVSHDIRNLVDVARTRVEAGADTGAPVHFEKAVESLDRMERIVSDLLVLAREGKYVDDVESVDFGNLVDIAWGTVDTGDATLSVEGPETIRADSGPLQQLLENCFRNACQHAEDDAVTVRVGPLDDGDGFYVADDGPGIPEDAREDVFDAGYTTHPDGTGLGLRIVARVAQAHGWTVDVTESEDGGARLEVRDVAVLD